MGAVNCRLGKEVQCYNENLVNLYNSDVKDNVKIGCFSELGGTTVGEGTIISAFCFLPPGTVVGRNCFIGPRFTATNHRVPEIDPNFVPEGVTIEDDVIIGACVTALAGITIGKGAKIGMGAVLLNDVPPNTTVIGFPAQERDDVWQPETLGPPRPTAKDIWHDNGGVYGPITQEEIVQNSEELDKLMKDTNAWPYVHKEQHEIDPKPALSSDHPYKKLFEKERFNREHGHLSTGSPYVKTTFKKEDHKCDGECDKGKCDCNDLPPAIDVTEWVGRAGEPVFCRELPEGFDWEKAGIPKVTAERLRALIDADEELILSKTKAHKKHRIPDRLPREGDYIGLDIGYQKDGRTEEKK
jgi:acetyltransferase-like isoleucine patch superfamily enzyme